MISHWNDLALPCVLEVFKPYLKSFEVLISKAYCLIKRGDNKFKLDAIVLRLLSLRDLENIEEQCSNSELSVKSI